MNGHAQALIDQAENNLLTWGEYERTPAEHLLILMEEVGEVARAMQTAPTSYQWPPAYNEAVYAELIDVGAVVLAMMRDCAEATP